ncbi:MAG: hypothetical protein ACKUBY_04240 [Candidatus Moraniibacteriota bacterium]|jgi:hypothetical protein
MNFLIKDCEDGDKEKSHTIKTINFVENGTIEIIIGDWLHRAKYRVWIFPSIADRHDIYRNYKSHWQLMPRSVGDQTERSNIIDALQQLLRIQVDEWRSFLDRLIYHE